MKDVTEMTLAEALAAAGLDTRASIQIPVRHLERLGDCISIDEQITKAGGGSDGAGFLASETIASLVQLAILTAYVSRDEDLRYWAKRAKRAEAVETEDAA